MQSTLTLRDAGHDAKAQEVMAYVSGLAQENQRLENELRDIKADHENEKQARRGWQEQSQTTGVALRELRLHLSSQKLVVVILDGDGAVFNSELYQRGRDGGAKAAHQLHTHIKADLATRYRDEDTNYWQILTHLVLSARALSRKLKHCGIISSDDQMTEFSHGWNSQSHTFWTDVGYGKERADHKIREILQMHMPAYTCKHVYFGPCTDTGYLTVLEGYKLDETASSKISLIETRPAERGFTQLGFALSRLPSVFRDSNLPEQHAGTTQEERKYAAPPMVSPGGIAVGTQELSEETGNIVRSSSTWATISTPLTGTDTMSMTTALPRPRYMLLNARDQRLDIELDKPSLEAEQRFNARTQNLCNDYHLRNRCDAGSACKHLHVKKLPEADRLVLQHKARGLPCHSGGYCRDFLCIFGHQCRFKNDCKAKKCRFDSFHGIDLRYNKKLVEGCLEPTKIM